MDTRGQQLNRLYLWGRWGLLGVAVVALALLAGGHFSNRDVVALDDFPEYWAAGRLNLWRQNPYSLEQMAELQRGIGRQQPVMMWNPPWVLVLVTPFALLPSASARLLWYGLHFGLAVWACDWLWLVYGDTVQKRWLAWLLALTFAPVLDALKYGQITVFLLAGSVLFLRAVRREHWLEAGMALALLLIKPHLLYLVVALALIWAGNHRKPGILVGLALAIVAATGGVLLVNPQVLNQYAAAVLRRPPVSWATATLGGMLRATLGPDSFWLQFAPMTVGLGWGLFHWIRRGSCWVWSEELPKIVLISVVTTAYGWTFDQSVLLLPLVVIAVRFWQGRWGTMQALLVVAYLLFDAWALFSSMPQLNYWWQALWLSAWWWVAWRVTCSREGSP